jgi:hypothetical protein
MTIARRDDYLTDAQGRALAGAQVYYCTQPANTGSVPPGPLAVLFNGISGPPGVPNPVITDGFGHAVAYLTAGVLYTVVFVHPLFATPVVLTDQQVGGSGGGSGYTPFSGVPSGTIDGVNRVFPLTNNGIAIPN